MFGYGDAGRRGNRGGGVVGVKSSPTAYGVQDGMYNLFVPRDGGGDGW